MGDKLRPVFLRKKDLATFRKKNRIWKEVDLYTGQLQELKEIRFSKSVKASDVYVYFPWNGNLVHMVGEKEYFEIRTNRNRNLITKTEQTKLHNSCIGILGLSVGNGLAIGLQYQGIANKLKLAEFDEIETTNLNRIQAGVADVGEKKLEFALRRIHEINPFCEIQAFEKGIYEKNIEKFINGKPKPKIIFEIIDDFEMKIKLRLVARKAGIPVVMAANLGDSVLFDIERYDLNPRLKLFNGLLGDFPERVLENPDEDVNKYAVQIVGIENVPKRALSSVKQIGKTLVGRPQLSSTVSINSSVCVYISRKIILGDKKLKGRVKLDLNEII